jgi:hypothetical protein
MVRRLYRFFRSKTRKCYCTGTWKKGYGNTANSTRKTTSKGNQPWCSELRFVAHKCAISPRQIPSRVHERHAMAENRTTGLIGRRKVPFWIDPYKGVQLLHSKLRDRSTSARAREGATTYPWSLYPCVPPLSVSNVSIPSRVGWGLVESIHTLCTAIFELWFDIDFPLAASSF